MDGYQYEKECAKLLESRGFSRVDVTKSSGDQGIDIIAFKDGVKYGIQCKYYDGTVGNKAVQEVYAGAGFYGCDKTLVITSSTLTKPAQELAKKLGVEVWEKIDAIYLQQNEPAYIKAQQEKKKAEAEREEKERLAHERRELQSFRKWKKEYLLVAEKRKQMIDRSWGELERDCNQQKADCTEKYDALRNAVEQQLQALGEEQKQLAHTLSGLGASKFISKLQGRRRLKAIEIELKALSDQVAEAKLSYDNEMAAIAQQMSLRRNELETQAEWLIDVPPLPDVVVQILTELRRRTNFIMKEDSASFPQSAVPVYKPMEMLAYVQHLRIAQPDISGLTAEGEYYKKLILGVLRSFPEGATRTDIIGADPELSVFKGLRLRALNKALSELEKEFLVTAKEWKGQTYFFYSNRAELFDTLTKYSDSDVREMLSQIKKETICRNEQLKEAIYWGLSDMGMTITELIQNEPILNGCSNQQVAALLRQLKQAGRVVSEERGGKAYFRQV